MKLAIILGTRPEIIRLSQIIKIAKNHLDVVVVHTGQNWDPNLHRIFFQQLGLPEPEYQLNVAGKDLGETMGNIISETYTILKNENPDALLVLGDTNSSLCCIPAKRLKIPIFHMEAGNRCFDYAVPEEINRVLVDSISDINLAYTENSRRNLIRGGVDKNNVFITGSPIPEVLSAYSEEIESSNILDKLDLEREKYFLVSIHREENLTSDRLTNILEGLLHCRKEFGLNMIFSTHPRTRIKLESMKFEEAMLEGIHFMDPVGLFDFLKLMKNAYCTLSDSGTISEESTFLKVPAVTLRHTIERPEAIENGNMIMTGFKKEDMVTAIKATRSLPSFSYPEGYFTRDVSSRVIKIVLSYYHVVNRTVWGKM